MHRVSRKRFTHDYFLELHFKGFTHDYFWELHGSGPLTKSLFTTKKGHFTMYGKIKRPSANPEMPFTSVAFHSSDRI